MPVCTRTRKSANWPPASASASGGLAQLTRLQVFLAMQVLVVPTLPLDDTSVDGRLDTRQLSQHPKILANIRAGGWVSRHWAPADGLTIDQLRQRFASVLETPVPAVVGGAPRTGTATAGGRMPIPVAFDWRDNTTGAGGGFKTCVGPVVDQGKCGACWAVSAAETMADRHCIATRLQTNATDAARVALSALDLVACDKLCKHLSVSACCRGCAGGYPELAWEYISKKGIVSEQCMPYNLTRSLLCPTPQTCPSDRQFFKVHAAPSYAVFGGPGFEGIKTSIALDGPVQATFTVYEDFMTYKSGVYTHVTGKKIGLHAVKVVGWGVDEQTNVSFWSAQNSWNASWGMEGSFKIAQDECGFEEQVHAGKPCVGREATFCVG